MLRGNLAVDINSDRVANPKEYFHLTFQTVFVIFFKKVLADFSISFADNMIGGL